MDQQQLRDQLDQLQEEIKQIDASHADKARLDSLIVDIERQLLEPILEDQQSLAEQVDSMVSGFERDHPTVAGILNNIMITLTSMGV